MNEKYELMRAAALAATPGPWATDDPYIVYAKTNTGITYLANTAELDVKYEDSVANAAFIAAANPAAILALLSDLTAQDKRIADLLAVKAELLAALRLAKPCVDRDMAAAIKENFGSVGDNFWANKAVDARDAVDRAIVRAEGGE